MNKASTLRDTLSDPLIQHVGIGTVAGLAAGAIHLSATHSAKMSALKKTILMAAYGSMGARTGLEVDSIRRIDSAEAWDPRVKKVLSNVVPESWKIKDTVKEGSEFDSLLQRTPTNRKARKYSNDVLKKLLLVTTILGGAAVGAAYTKTPGDVK